MWLRERKKEHKLCFYKQRRDNYEKKDSSNGLKIIDSKKELFQKIRNISLQWKQSWWKKQSKKFKKESGQEKVIEIESIH